MTATSRRRTKTPAASAFLVTAGKPDQLGDAKEEEVEEPDRVGAYPRLLSSLPRKGPGHRVRMALWHDLASAYQQHATGDVRFESVVQFVEPRATN